MTSALWRCWAGTCAGKRVIRRRKRLESSFIVSKISRFRDVERQNIHSLLDFTKEVERNWAVSWRMFSESCGGNTWASTEGQALAVGLVQLLQERKACMPVESIKLFQCGYILLFGSGGQAFPYACKKSKLRKEISLSSGISASKKALSGCIELFFLKKNNNFGFVCTHTCFGPQSAASPSYSINDGFPTHWIP